MPPVEIERADATPTVTVRGDAFVRAEPDEAMLWITLSALADAPGPALSDVAGRSNALSALLDELGVARPDRSTTGITVWEDVDHTAKGRRSLGHRAVARVSVRLSDASLIGELIAQATKSLQARIDGPRWQIAPSNPVRLEAARAAAADAERKARAYAEGVGARLGPLVRLAEPDAPLVPAPAMRSRAAMAGDQALPVEPGEHEVAASIYATFMLELD
jgi:uncharacterized protein YggE